MAFTPHLPAPRPCWHCTRYVALIHGGSAAWCTLPDGPRVRSAPAWGCSAWQRETGADDDPDAVPGACAPQRHRDPA